jgi:hypothetical protein
VKKDFECPINDAYIIPKNTPFSNNFQGVDLADGFKLIFTRVGNFMPVVRFTLTEGKVCFNTNGYQTSRGRILYPLSDYGKCSRGSYMRITDPRYKNIGEIKEDRLFKDNEIFDVISSLPDYPVNDTKEFSWNLYLNNYFYWSHY